MNNNELYPWRRILDVLAKVSVAMVFICEPLVAAWPAIRPVHITRTYNIKDDSDTPLTAFIETADGAPVYKLECHNGNYEDLSFIDFSGDFQCALYSVEAGRRTSWNLLASDDRSEQRSDFLNRGRMTANQLWRECGAIPEYGRTRHFRLRGMHITFEFKNLHWASRTGPTPPQLIGFTFDVDVLRDAGSESATAETVRAPWPGAPCQ